MMTNREAWRRVLTYCYDQIDPTDVDTFAAYLDETAEPARPWLLAQGHDERQTIALQQCVLNGETWTHAARVAGVTREAIKDRLIRHRPGVLLELARLLPRSMRKRIELRAALTNRDIELAQWHLLDIAVDHTLTPAAQGDDPMPASVLTKTLEKLTQLERDRRIGRTAGLPAPVEESGNEPGPTPTTEDDEVAAWLKR